MKVIFYLHSTGLCGGIRVVLEYCARLLAAGIDCELWTPPAPTPTWFPRRIVHKAFGSLDQLGQAARATRAHKVATWWETAYWVNETIRHDDIGFYLVQDIETTYANSEEQKKKILATYRMGLVPLPTSKWVEMALIGSPATTPIVDVMPRFVGLGIDHDVFAPLPMMREQFRIFTPYRPGAGPKGWLCGRDVVERCKKLEPRTSLVTFGNQGAPRDVPSGVPHIHVNTPSDAKLRELYCQAGVFLMPSDHEGFGLTALEAMACGCPVVMTDCNGNREYSMPGTNCLTAAIGDGVTLARHCATIMGDMVLANMLGANGLNTAKLYDWDKPVQRMIQALST